MKWKALLFVLLLCPAILILVWQVPFADDRLMGDGPADGDGEKTATNEPALADPTDPFEPSNATPTENAQLVVNDSKVDFDIASEGGESEPEAYLEKTVQLKRAAAEDLPEEIYRRLPGLSSVSVDQRANVVRITGQGELVRKAVRIAQNLDAEQPSLTAAEDPEKEDHHNEFFFEIVRLNNIPAEEAVKILNYFTVSKGIRLDADARANLLLMAGKKEDVEQVIRSAKLIDSGAGQRGKIDDRNSTAAHEDDASAEEEGSSEGSADLDFSEGGEALHEDDAEELFARRMEQLEELDQKTQELKEAYKRASGKLIQKLVQDQLEEVVSDTFRTRQQVHRLQILRLESRLREVERKLHERERHRERIIEEQTHLLIEEAKDEQAAALEELSKPTASDLELQSYAKTNSETRKGKPNGIIDPIESSTVRVNWRFPGEFGHAGRFVATTGTIIARSDSQHALAVVGLPDQEQPEAALEGLLQVTIVRAAPFIVSTEAKVASVDIDSGLAVVVTDLGEDVTPPQLQTEVSTGEKFRAIWSNAASAWSESEGVITRTRQELARAEGRDPIHVILHDVDAPESAAGGTLVNREGKIIGVLSLTGGEGSGGVGFAIPAHRVSALLQAARESLVEGQRNSGAINWESIDATAPQYARELRDIRIRLMEATEAASQAERRLNQLTELKESGIVTETQLETAHQDYRRTFDKLEEARTEFDENARETKEFVTAGKARHERLLENLENEMLGLSNAEDSEAAKSRKRELREIADDLESEMEWLGIIDDLISRQEQAKSETLNVLVVTKELRVGDFLDETNTEFRSYPSSLAPQNSVTDEDQYKERTSRVHAFPGDVITLDKLAQKGETHSLEIPQGMRAVTVLVDGATSLNSEEIEPGDQIDVVDTRYERESRVASTLESVKVLSIGSSSDSKIVELTLVLRPDAADAVKAAEQAGALQIKNHRSSRPSKSE